MAVHASHAALPYPIKGARYSMLVPLLDADGDPTAQATPDTEISKDNAAATDAAEEVSATSGMDGMGLITFTGAETDCTTLAVNFKASGGPKATLAMLYPRVLAEVGTGTLSAGSAGGGTLGTLIPYDVTGCFIKTTGGTGGGGTGGADNQARKIVTYNTETGEFTVSPNWETTPSTDTTYAVLLPEGVTLGMLQTLNPTTAGRKLDVTATGAVTLADGAHGGPGTTLTFARIVGDANHPDDATVSLTNSGAGRTIEVLASSANPGIYLTNARIESALTVGSIAAAFNGSLSGNVNGKIIGSGGSTIVGVGARVVDASGAAVATAIAQTTMLDAIQAGAASAAGADDKATTLLGRIGTPTGSETVLGQLDTAVTQAAAAASAAGTAATAAGAAAGGVATLLERISAPLFAGITSLAHWLRAMMRKDAADGTALGEINAGGGTYDPATDSQEAIRDRGDAAWVTGGGGGGGDGFTSDDRAKLEAVLAKTDNLPADPARESSVAEVRSAIGTPTGSETVLSGVQATIVNTAYISEQIGESEEQGLRARLAEINGKADALQAGVGALRADAAEIKDLSAGAKAVADKLDGMMVQVGDSYVYSAPALANAPAGGGGGGDGDDIIVNIEEVRIGG